MWLALREAWWPIAVAVAWVLLRNRAVVDQLLARHPRKPVTFTTVAVHAAALKASDKRPASDLRDSEAAFRELSHRWEAGDIEVVGTPFVRVGDQSGSSALTMGNQQTIFYTEFSSLIPHDDGGELCLIPRDRRAARGSKRNDLRGYRNVQVRSTALVGAFPETMPQLAHAPNGESFSPAPKILPATKSENSHARATSAPPRRSRSGRTSLQQAVLDAKKRLWPDGKMPMVAKRRDEAIAREVEKTHGISVSGATIRRALQPRRRQR